MARPAIIGWDVGGAHLKASRVDADGVLTGAVQVPVPLWQGLGPLRSALDHSVLHLGPADAHAITMTGEMVDLFRNRQEGVRCLVDTLVERLGGAQARFYAGDLRFLDSKGAVADAHRVASANWQATAALVARRLGACLLIDVGSTTTDVIVVSGGRVRARGADDAERLMHDELVYTGIVRTPLMALAERVPFRGEWAPVIPELFATTADVYRLTGELPEEADQHPAADGGEKTAAGSARRLARMIGRDPESAALAEWRGLAAWFAGAQFDRIVRACERARSRGLLDPGAPLVGAGTGRFLVRRLARLLECPYLDFAELVASAPTVSAWIGACAPAVAVALLLRHAAIREAPHVGG